MPDLPPVTERDHTRGSAEARHTLIQYGDFECPFSHQVSVVVSHVLKAFPDDVRFVFRHFPLRQHPNALAAAEAAEAAASQGSFWAMHDRLFANQLALSTNELVMHADGLGLDAREVRTALREGAFRENILTEKRAAVAAGVTNTLNLVIDGEIFLDAEAEDALIEHVVAPLKAART